MQQNSLESEPIYTFPTPHKGKWTATDEDLRSVQEHLQTAVFIELSTIPLYLFAAYSINEDTKVATEANPEGDIDAKQEILHIVKQEMLHLGLAGNILKSIGGRPSLYGPTQTPSFPVRFFKDPKVELHLGPATPKNIETFMNLERPAKPPKSLMGDVVDKYNSIGEFYDATREGLVKLSKAYDKWNKENPDKEQKVLFQPSTFSKQFKSGDGSWRGKEMKVIENLEIANAAITLIIEQGEGDGTPSDKSNHYQTFQQLFKGPKLTTRAVSEDPKTKQYEKYPVYAAMVASDAAYCYLLLSIEKMWQYDGNGDSKKRNAFIIKNLRSLMIRILGPFAEFLFSQEIETGQNACAPYNFYQFETSLSEKEQLVALVKAASDRYPGLKDVLTATEELHDIKNI